MIGRMRGVVALAALAVVLVACAPSSGPVKTTATSATQTQTPTPTPTPPTPSELAAERIDAMPVRDRAALVVMGTTAGADPATLAGYVAAGPEGLILMGGNVPASPGELRTLTDAVHAASADAVIAIDQEGGDVKRMPWDDSPSARTLKSEPPAATQAAFTQRAQLLADAGIDINFGVVADVPRSDASFIYRRSFGTDPSAVADRVAAAVAGEKGVVSTTLKHFPGHGAAEGDSHHSIPTTEMSLAEWQATDAVPFAAGVDAGAELVMTGHLRFTAVSDRPASLSPEWYEILRDELDFEGVAVTDDLGMLLSSGDPAYADPVADAVMAIEAGADMVLMVAGSTADTATQIIDGLTDRAAADPAFDARLAEAAARVVLLGSETMSG